MDDLKSLITKLHNEKYPDANVIFLAGSVIRGEATKTSDLDIVVVYDSLPNAYRDSYYYGGWPVEAFVHDPQTLEYFIYKVDAPGGIPSLAAMVCEGIELPSVTPLSQVLKKLSNEALDAGPPRWTENEMNNSRYFISDLIEDIKASRTRNEMYATASELYHAISNHFFRSQGLWSAKGKTIPRRLHKIDATFAVRFESAFDSVFAYGQVDDLIALVTVLMSKNGGFLFDGYRLDAPPKWRVE